MLAAPRLGWHLADDRIKWKLGNLVWDLVGAEVSKSGQGCESRETGGGRPNIESED